MHGALCCVDLWPHDIYEAGLYLSLNILSPFICPPQKDSHILYLEQELESLKVVLDIKNKQLHQQEKKLMEIDKLVRNRGR